MHIVNPVQHANNSNLENMTDQEIWSEKEILNRLILVVDDDLLIRELFRLILNKAGFHNIQFAEDGRTGLNYFLQHKPDLVILDIHMPELNGIEFLGIVRADPQFDNIPIIVETADNELEARNKILRAGATNILSKPLDAIIVLDRIKTHLENQQLVLNLKNYQNRLRQELDAAQKMQNQLLPKNSDITELETKYRISLDWHYQPSSELSGDCWGARAIDDHRFVVYVVDFTGHGVGAAINTFRLHMLMHEISATADQPDQQLYALNNQLNDVLPLSQFATMLYAVIDTQLDTIHYASAGHTPLLIAKPDGQVYTGDPKGLPLGIKKDVEYKVHETQFDKGDVCFLYTDALIETPGIDLPDLRTDGLIDLLTHSLASPDDKPPLYHLMKKFYERSQSPIPDDLTAIWVGSTPRNNTPEY